MAFTIMGGLSVATFLTLFLLPAIYALWFRRSLGPKIARSGAESGAPCAPLGLAWPAE
jgi:multidrug efflux pump